MCGGSKVTTTVGMSPWPLLAAWGQGHGASAHTHLGPRAAAHGHPPLRRAERDLLLPDVGLSDVAQVHLGSRRRFCGAAQRPSPGAQSAGATWSLSGDASPQLRCPIGGKSLLSRPGQVPRALLTPWGRGPVGCLLECEGQAASWRTSVSWGGPAARPGPCRPVLWAVMASRPVTLQLGTQVPLL